MTLYLGAIIIGVLFFGAIHTWVYTIVFLAVMAASLLLLKGDVIRQEKKLYFRWVKTDLSPLFFAFFAYIIIQMLPLPQGLLTLISPEAKIDGDMAQPAVLALNPAGFKDHWYNIVPYIYPVRMSLIRWLTYGLLFFGLTRCLNSRRRIEQAIVTILLLGCFDALYGIMQTYSGYNHIWWYKNTDYVKSVIGTYLNRSHFAGFMEMGIALAIAYAAALGKRAEGQALPPRRRSLRKWFVEVFFGNTEALKRFLIVFAGGVMGLGLILSASRGGIIAVTGVLFIMGLFFVFLKSERRKGLVILSIFGIAMIYGLYTGLDYTIGRFDFFGQDKVSRDIMAEKAFTTFKDYTATGVGLGNFRHASGRYQDPVHKGLYVDYAHNDYAQFLAEAGVVGMLLLVVGLFWYLVRTFLLWRERSNSFSVCLGIAPFGAIIAMAIHSWSDYNLHRPANVMLLIAIIAIGNAALRLERHRHHGKVIHECRLIPLRRRGMGLLIGAVGLILWSGVWSVRHFIAETYCNTGINITLNLEENPAAERAQSAMFWDGGNAGYPYKLAQALMRERDKRMAPPAQDMEGWKRSHGPIIAELERAIRLNPLNPEYHVRLAWEYSYLWDRPDYVAKWLPAADICLDRAAYVAGGWLQNPKLHYDMGNYWTMRTKTLGPDNPKSKITWTKAVWQYRKGMELEKIKELPKDVQVYIRYFFDDQAHLQDLK
ncbi:MAG: O-antigen ligase family protein [Syntrophales bacterium]|nr:O-antigen ligase family protein [Syntrophales bacterium]